jgi:hypothetical protein
LYLCIDGYCSVQHVPALQVLEGNGVVASARKIIGATNPLASEPGTIRGDFAIEVGRNVVHGSDSPESGERETGVAFDALSLPPLGSPICASHNTTDADQGNGS